MRVIAGTHKGRRLQPPVGRGVRPTSDRVREALFSILAPRVQEARVLDLYAGTGAVGLEALSRGAGRVVFVEENQSSLQLIQENLKRCHYPSEATVISSDVGKVSKHLEFMKWAPYNIVFADPPYDSPDISLIVSMVSSQVPLHPEGIVVFEHQRKLDLPQRVETLAQVRQARYGQTMLTFFKPQASDISHANRHLSRNL